ncbi:hypothetical protein CWE07_10495 [Aliidiomarina maris]|uniref:Uncharacterized protein n=1 Tax=Aliidiomarina maris TaxID=531312 RepID=A0A327WU14_9GAMM|nr:hypothetical protein B0I24_1097 [Aliidiomarina maris]RUO22895.1 hypothetical protein CWE07_10495 [Aliidiomarina maris]
MLIIGKKLSPYALLSISGLLAASDQAVKWLAKDKNREGRGYSFEVMRARMLYTTKHKKKAPTAKVSPFYKKTIGYGLPDFAEELNYGVDLSTI